MSPSPPGSGARSPDVVDQPDDLRELRRFHKVLADVNRLRIVRRLADGPATVTELIEHVGLSQPLVSWHLGKLREVGLVTARRKGRETIHTIVPEAFDVRRARGAGAGPRDHRRRRGTGLVSGSFVSPGAAGEDPGADAPDRDRARAGSASPRTR